MIPKDMPEEEIAADERERDLTGCDLFGRAGGYESAARMVKNFANDYWWTNKMEIAEVLRNISTQLQKTSEILAQQAVDKINAKEKEK